MQSLLTLRQRACKPCAIEDVMPLPTLMCRFESCSSAEVLWQRLFCTMTGVLAQARVWREFGAPLVCRSPEPKASAGAAGIAPGLGASCR